MSALTVGPFVILLRAFNKLVSDMPPKDKISADLLEIRKSALNTPEKDMNARQKEAITARIDNYLAGTYGNTKTKENYNHQTPTK